MAKKTKPATAVRTEGEILEALSYDYPYFGCFNCDPGWMTIRGPEDWLYACPKCGHSLTLFDGEWGSGKQPVKRALPAIRVAIFNRVREARQLERECERDPRKRALEAELEGATVALSIKGGRGWQRRIERENEVMYGPGGGNGCGPDIEAFYWRHLPPALRAHLLCLDKLSWLVEQWYEYGLSGKPEEFDVDLAEMRQLLKLVKACPYNVRASAQPARRPRRAAWPAPALA
jgi:hypothetical protein